MKGVILMEQAKLTKEEMKSKKGSVYEALVIDFNGYRKIVFMTDAEKVIFRDFPLTKKVG